MSTAADGTATETIIWHSVSAVPPPNDVTLLVIWCGKSTQGVHRTKPYHSRGGEGWRICREPANPWMWMKGTPPTHWAHPPKGPEA